MKHIFLLPALLLFAIIAHAQTIKGKVTDAETGKPIAGASVYLNGTFVGTVTDTLGVFMLTTNKTTIPLVVSYVGYTTHQISNYAGVDLQIMMTRKPTELDEVTVTADAMSRANKMRIFLTEFLGASTDCYIENPGDVWLHYSKNTEELTGGADKPLIIHNKKLGYKITYYLSSFRHVPTQTAYEGNYIFAEDTAGLKRSAMKQLLKDRDEAYYGSRMHFIRALWADQLAKNTFDIYHPMPKAGGAAAGDKPGISQLSYNDLVAVKSNAIFHDQKFIVLKDEVSVNYQRSRDVRELSYLQLAANSAGAMIDADGNYGEGIEWRGDMGHSRVNKLLPFEFQPVVKRDKR
ncbi:carboxypeptidase-like regulatory domain-containing protein [Mucilaginibacter mali]|uniref:Carboxypeptidase-like regulatory domain-containing protein n=1 Tax=Mucilaginibacter mali TaxID=2740462 RepID=A0A7D4UAY4_9SPHI|nr:carboxypeptidase-like regulatory domain-containing protein [Mucilaginibacter mali]QKJ30398.1 carboxypeptidase-like regulatory domain-containing protein [Mucilaginibacter mali]